MTDANFYASMFIFLLTALFVIFHIAGGKEAE